MYMDRGLIFVVLGSCGAFPFGQDEPRQANNSEWPYLGFVSFLGEANTAQKLAREIEPSYPRVRVGVHPGLD